MAVCFYDLSPPRSVAQCKVVGDVPEAAKEDKLAKMLAWRGAIATCL